MSLLTRKNATIQPAGLRGRAVHTARHAVPIAKNAGLATQNRARGAIGRAKPQVYRARSWAAPRVERAGLAVRDRIGPRIAAMLVAAAHRLDTKQSRPRRWPKMVAGSALLAAVGSAITAMATRHRPGALTSKRAGPTAVAGSPEPPQPASSPVEPGQPGEPGSASTGAGPTG